MPMSRLLPIVRLLTATCLSIVCIWGASARAADEYLLGPQDKVRIKVFEWRASRDEIFEWKALNDDFTVGPSGFLSLPLAGEIKAAGLSTNALARAIGVGLMENMGLGRKPDTAVEVVQFRPFYIVGHVMQSGEFAYRPGLTVLQALSLSGGLRIRAEDNARFEREVIQGRGEVGLFRLDEVNLLARKARLEAELAHNDDIRFPTRLVSRQDDDVVAMVLKQERLIFQARSEGLDTQVRALENLRNFLQKELAALEEQLVFLDKQIDSIRKELANVTSLVAKGFAAAPRQFGLERTLAQAQSERLSAETSLLRSRQEISRTDISILELRDGRRNEVAKALSETQAEINALDRKMTTTRQLLYDSEVTAPRLRSSREQSEGAAPVYTIFRSTSNGAIRELSAQETSLVEPGDTIKVEIPLPDTFDNGDITAIEPQPGPGVALGLEMGASKNVGVQ